MKEFEIYKSASRGQADHGWLKTFYSFSFSNYYDPNRMGFGALRVINDDMIAPSMGFPEHSHDNMEIVTIPLSGALKHQDSEGNKAVITADEVQLMSAGTGVAHSEYNNSTTEAVNLLQIWVLPKKRDIQPRYDQKIFPAKERRNKLQTIISPIDTDLEGIKINQDSYFTRVDLDPSTEIHYHRHLSTNGIFIFLLEGSATVGSKFLDNRDAIGMWDQAELTITSKVGSQILIIEVPR